MLGKKNDPSTKHAFPKCTRILVTFRENVYAAEKPEAEGGKRKNFHIFFYFGPEENTG